MDLNELKELLDTIDVVNFILPDGTPVPQHFHVTEIGQIEKNFIDCGGVLRKETTVNFQLWHSTDYDHRLGASKLRKIIALSEERLGLKNATIEVEYQESTVGKYGIEFQQGQFLLTPTQTDCLAKDACGITTEKPKIKLSDINNCQPGSGCC